MKIINVFLKIPLLIFIGFIFFTSCHKDAGKSTDNGSGVLTPPSGPSGLLYDNREIFVDQKWDTSGNGYKTILKTWRLTPQAITKGFKVYGAIAGADDDPWVLIPGSSYNFWLSDLVTMSYTTNVDSLVIRATTIRDLTLFQSDFYIEYNR